MKLAKKLIKYLLIFLSLTFILILTLTFYPIAEPLSQKNNTQATIIKNINIVDALNDTIISNQSILIEHNKIVKISHSDSISQTPEYLVIDGQGKYAMAGLWDMHSHLAFHIAPQAIMPLHIASGVTNIRDMQGIVNINDERKAWKKQVDNNTLLGPRIIAYADGLVGGIYDDENIEEIVDQSAKDPSTFVKVYSYISEKRFGELAIKAEAKGVTIAGHYPDVMNPIEASNAGQKSFEHGYLFLYHSFPESESYREYYRHKYLETEPNPIERPSRQKNLANLDMDKFYKLAKTMASNGTYFCPTHITRRYEVYADDSDFLKDPRLQYIPPLVKTIWNSDAESMQERLKADKKYYNDVYKKGLELTKLAHEQGVKILAGTDSYDPWSFPGYSLHAELEELVKAGLTPAQSLQCATITPAEYAGLSDTYGSIEKGKVADIILLKENPLDDIRNSTTITGLFYNNNFYTQEELNAFQEYVSNNTSGWNGLSMSAKIFFRMMKDN